ncbi:MAG TPA: TlyA family RNA methyltransferase [Candidatus Saccharimonadales bacterium]|nr:TlyA family RNA methyltransferase [Candidatus Saccharimonadales bacterium]
MKQRLDLVLVGRGLVETRSQAESWIRLGRVSVADRIVKKPGFFVADNAVIKLKAEEQYVSRAGLKLASVASVLGINFDDKVVLDVGSSTGGFTDYALKHGAQKVIAVDVGTDQMHPSLRGDDRVELHEKTNILDVGRLAVSDSNNTVAQAPNSYSLSSIPDIVVMDLSFVSLRHILPHIAGLCGPRTQVVAMVKPQFEAGKHQVNKGVIKNNAVRRQILKEFEAWVKDYFMICDKADSQVHGASGNQERFYLLTPLTK